MSLCYLHARGAVLFFLCGNVLQCGTTITTGTHGRHVERLIPLNRYCSMCRWLGVEHQIGPGSYASAMLGIRPRWRKAEGNACVCVCEPAGRRVKWKHKELATSTECELMAFARSSGHIAHTEQSGKDTQRRHAFRLHK